MRSQFGVVVYCCYGSVSFAMRCVAASFYKRQTAHLVSMQGQAYLCAHCLFCEAQLTVLSSESAGPLCICTEDCLVAASFHVMQPAYKRWWLEFHSIQCKQNTVQSNALSGNQATVHVG